MRFRFHVYATVIVSLISLLFIPWYFTILVFFAHFIPSVKFVIKKVSKDKRFYKRVSHNVFLFLFVYLASIFLLPVKVAFFICLNHLTHLVMDMQGDGIELFYPVSNRRYRFW